jgi:hypothetical protein
MEKNIEELAKVGEMTLKTKLFDNIIKIRRNLQYLTDYPKENICLIIGVNAYNRNTHTFKEKYGLEFPELQKKYEEMLPEIKKYIKVEE